MPAPVAGSTSCRPIRAAPIVPASRRRRGAEPVPRRPLRTGWSCARLATGVAWKGFRVGRPRLPAPDWADQWRSRLREDVRDPIAPGAYTGARASSS